ncbi:hypothetical protein NC652_021729 [Populus alba x Populus x berolinensis]|nr:hypothetical protein NC652_021729 [Populus alba x Populus x berolinensis]
MQPACPLSLDTAHECLERTGFSSGKSILVLGRCCVELVPQDNSGSHSKSI